MTKVVLFELATCFGVFFVCCWRRCVVIVPCHSNGLAGAGHEASCKVILSNWAVHVYSVRTRNFNFYVQAQGCMCVSICAAACISLDHINMAHPISAQQHPRAFPYIHFQGIHFSTPNGYLHTLNTLRVQHTRTQYICLISTGRSTLPDSR